MVVHSTGTGETACTGADEFAESSSGGGTPAGSVDFSASVAKLAGKKKQAAGKPIKVKVSCDEASSVIATGNATVIDAGSSAARDAGKHPFRLKTAQAELAAGEKKTLRLKLKGKKNAKKLKKAAKKGGKGKAKIKLKVADAAGNQSSTALGVKLKK